MISSSREEIRYKLLSEYTNLLKLQGETLDNSDNAFNTYVFNTLSYQIADLIYYATVNHRESVLTSAELPSTIRNWAIYLGYKPQKAKPSQIDLLIQISIKEPFSAVIPYEHKFIAQDTVFRSQYKYTINVLPNKITVSRTDPVTNTTQQLPYQITSENGEPYLNFIVSALQYDIQIDETNVPELQPLEFFSYDVYLPEGQQVYKVEVEEIYDGVTTEFYEDKLILLSNTDTGFEVIPTNSGFEVLFGNGLFGRQPRGEIKITTRYTKGKSGNIIPGIQITGDPLLSEFPVEYKVINVVGSKDGVDYENKYEVKRNAIASLRMLNRIVSESDYKDIPTVLRLDTNIQTIPILKRSDLATNDVFIYITLPFKDSLCWTNSIPIKKSDITSIKPFLKFNYNNTEWLCPFLITLNSDIEISTLYYVQLYSDVNLEPKIVSDNSSITSSNITYDIISDTFKIITKTVIGFTQTYSQQVIVRSPLTSVTITPDSVTQLSDNTFEFQYTVSRIDMQKATLLEIQTIVDNVLSSNYAVLQTFINELTYRDIAEINGTEYILDVPVIEYSYWTNLSDDERNELISIIVQSFSDISNNYKNRMTNVSLRTSFTKTYGKLENLKYSTPDYITQLLVTSIDQIPSPNQYTGHYIAVSLENLTGPHIEYSGNLLYSDGSTWNLHTVSSGTIIKNSDGITYITDGYRWIRPDYSIPLNIVVEIHTSVTSDYLLSKVKETIYNFVNNLGIEQSLYLSQLIKQIQSIENVHYCRIIEPKTDIVFRDILKNLKSDELKLYTPEYVYTKPELIKLVVKYV